MGLTRRLRSPPWLGDRVLKFRMGLRFGLAVSQYLPRSAPSPLPAAPATASVQSTTFSSGSTMLGGCATRTAGELDRDWSTRRARSRLWPPRAGVFPLGVRVSSCPCPPRRLLVFRRGLLTATRPPPSRDPYALCLGGGRGGLRAAGEAFLPAWPCPKPAPPLETFLAAASS